MSNVYAVILAGGSGQRFWPLSRELNPKQLLSMFGTESLIAQAVHRILPFAEGGSSIAIATNERLFDELRNHLTAQPDPALHAVRYIQEPLPKNTAPAIALAAATFAAQDPDAIMVVLPSDHLLEDGEVWADCIGAATSAAEDGYLVTIGISPTRPETGYGYIMAGAALPQFTQGTATPHVAARFVEKPELEIAEKYVASGDYFWNAGIFVMKASRVLEELDAAGGAEANIADVCRWIAAQPAENRNGAEARARFGEIVSISIDKAVMERSDRVAVIPAPLKWSDVGSLLALEDVAPADEHGVVRSGRGIDIDSKNSIVYSTDRLVATLGVEDMIVVDTTDATLVLPKSRAQDVRMIVDALKEQGAPEVTQPKVSLRPWGNWMSLLQSSSYQIKLIDVKPGARLSLQKHHHRSEHWIVVSGTALVTIDGVDTEVHQNEGIFLPVGSVHRLANCGKVPVQFIEVQVGEYLGEDDIVRFEDDYARDDK
ncbi:MAG: mannose-1-phosphate guanylyltransferase/mannose-6-phosphate isomerase [Actinobacteria bacterium HGW-Actinobacteria-7]|jgi:mannose-1-phosphate guanylyltransferase/mannose-6-phosphate isomerase|nr:MAG: mannose-1-phosphate guanylyltransferase/mannose-6-phosphate isomerase [Actinobacteria bacterium HGW-Actinobacteria-7]